MAGTSVWVISLCGVCNASNLYVFVRNLYDFFFGMNCVWVGCYGLSLKKLMFFVVYVDFFLNNA